MPTRNPRINVTLRPEHYELISRLAALQKRSRADVLRELFETVCPVLERVAVVGEAAQRAKVQALEGFRESTERAEATILPHLQSVMGQLDLLVVDAVARLEGVANTHGRVATGSDVAASSVLKRLEVGAEGDGQRPPEAAGAGAALNLSLGHLTTKRRVASTPGRTSGKRRGVSPRSVTRGPSRGAKPRKSRSHK